MNKYFGKYRAIVVEINDTEKRGRIKVKCPSVLGESRSNWCEPCVPIEYDNGGDFCLPKVGETAWIEFEAGDVNKPIYVGNWWSKEKTPSTDYNPNIRIISHDGSRIEISASGIKIKSENTEINLADGSMPQLNGLVSRYNNLVALSDVKSELVSLAGVESELVILADIQTTLSEIATYLSDIQWLNQNKSRIVLN